MVRFVMQATRSHFHVIAPGIVRVNQNMYLMARLISSWQRATYRTFEGVYLLRLGMSPLSNDIRMRYYSPHLFIQATFFATHLLLHIRHGSHNQCPVCFQPPRETRFLDGTDDPFDD